MSTENLTPEKRPQFGTDTGIGHDRGQAFFGCVRWGRLSFENGEGPIGCSRPLVRPWAAGLPPTPIGTSSQTGYQEFAVIRAAERLLFPAARSCMCRRIGHRANVTSSSLRFPAQ